MTREDDRDAAPPRAARRSRGHSRRRRRRRRAGALALAAVAAAIAVATILVVTRSGDDGPVAPFVASAGTAPATLWAVGDSADGGEGARRVADLIGRDPGARLLYLGDVYERGTAKEWEENYEPAYGRFAGSTAPTPGNHEWYLRDEGYRAYWKRKKRREVPDYYDFRIAGWQILSLNSEHELEAGSKQVRWLESRLDGPGTCRLAFFHRARYTAGSHDDDPRLETLWRPLVGKAAAVVNAHDHNMQRLTPRDGIAAYIAGAGGHSHYALSEKDPALEFSNDTRDGALRIDLRPGQARMTFVATNGRVLDRSTVSCSP